MRDGLDYELGSFITFLQASHDTTIRYVHDDMAHPPDLAKLPSQLTNITYAQNRALSMLSVAGYPHWCPLTTKSVWLTALLLLISNMH
jgi:hypothetical protein